MTLHKFATAVAASAISMATAAVLAGAVALPLSPAAKAPAALDANVPVELVHGCHRGVQRDYSGWHFHSGACVRVPTAPPGLHDYYANRRYYRGPLCSYRCKFVGPVKTCTQVCR